MIWKCKSIPDVLKESAHITSIVPSNISLLYFMTKSSIIIDIHVWWNNLKFHSRRLIWILLWKVYLKWNQRVFIRCLRRSWYLTNSLSRILSIFSKSNVSARICFPYFSLLIHNFCLSIQLHQIYLLLTQHLISDFKELFLF